MKKIKITDARDKNRSFAKILDAASTRRELLRGGFAGAVSLLFAGPAHGVMHLGRTRRSLSKQVAFTPLPVAEGSGPWPAISPDYDWRVLIPWGEPLWPGGPAFQHPPSSADQALQIGFGHDGMVYFAVDDGISNPNTHGLLVVNHEKGDNIAAMGVVFPETLEQVRASQHAHGVSVVEIHRVNGRWQSVAGKFSRRIHVNTPVLFAGPAAGHMLLDNAAANPPLGTLNNCGSGRTPWGTYLTCEENFNHYFAIKTPEFVLAPKQRRYGLSVTGKNYGWADFDPRFDLSHPDYLNEANRFGWVVEIDPADPVSVPVKRTALGRFKHECAAMVTGKNGRAVCYMGDDQRFDYIYRYVSDNSWADDIAQGLSPLDTGTLYAARFDADGTGQWLELSLDNPALTGHFATQAELLIYARVAADIVDATPMDRPEWITVAPDGNIYCSLTENVNRLVADAANPLAPNPAGHIVRITDTDGHVGTAFDWAVYLLAESTHGTEDTFSNPDSLYADPDGRLFIATDGNQADNLNDQLIVADTGSGELRRLFTSVPRAELSGITLTPDRRTMFINLQHPGNYNPALTNFPALTDGVSIPRDATIVITKRDGGIIGS